MAIAATDHRKYLKSEEDAAAINALSKLLLNKLWGAR